ncbi:hypothetical protein ANN_24386 [Periplaneta americana]|uniref:DUF4817 domain-containing protein n=1 Tax=Periplaneta americana TaxID=6978 RepID=A0ABQ8S300_PERAM|nr:hypothetical protein ANN_24386 [Periplaneta americana]
MWDPYVGKRGQGRPRLRWSDMFDKEEGKQWSRTAKNRVLWKELGKVMFSILRLNEMKVIISGEMSPGFSSESYATFALNGLRKAPEKNLNQGIRIGATTYKSNLHHMMAIWKQREKRKEVVANRILQKREEKLQPKEDVNQNERNFEEAENIYMVMRYLKNTGHNFRSLPSKETLRGHSDSSFRGEGYIQCCVGVRLCDIYSNQELAEIHFMYGKADGSAALARRLYQEMYPQRQCPDRKTFVRLHYRLCEYGKFNLDRTFPDRWIGRGGPIAWPPRSPDLNPLDFYLWSHLKSLVYSSPVPDLESLRNRIVVCSEDIRNTPGVWDRVRRSMRHRCEVCIQAGGGHFEHLL